MKWNKLIESSQNTLERGALFRTPAKWPYEQKVDFMLMESPNSESGFGLWVTSGYKAGLILVQLPKEALYKKERAISCQWMKENWQKWIYPDSTPEQVIFTDHYLVGE